MADLSVAKRELPGQDPVAAGTRLTYLLTVTNDGPSAAPGVSVVDVLPVGLHAEDMPAYCAQEQTSGAQERVTCALGVLEAGSVRTVTVTAQVAAGLAPGVVTNQAIVTSATADNQTANNTASEQTTVTAIADVALTLRSEPTSVTAGEEFNYTLVVRNAGPSLARTVALTDVLPAGVDFVGAVVPGLPGCRLRVAAGPAHGGVQPGRSTSHVAGRPRRRRAHDREGPG